MNPSILALLLLALSASPTLAQDPFAQRGEFIGVVGDGIINGNPEECDDGDAVGGDGCDANGQIEDGWSCTGEPSVCGNVIVFVGSGGDAFNCNGTADHTDINNALSNCAGNGSCRAVRLRAGLTCTLSGGIVIPDNRALEGETGGARPQLNMATTVGTGTIGLTGDGSPLNIALRHFNLDMNCSSNGSANCTAGTQLRGAVFSNSTDLIIQDMVVTDSGSDAFQLGGAFNVHAWGNELTGHGHEPYYFVNGADNARVHDDPNLSSIGNSCVRSADSSDIKIYRQTCTSAAGACFQIQEATGRNELWESICTTNSAVAGIWAFGTSSTHHQVYITNNIVRSGSGPGININGYDALIENNTIHGRSGDAINDNDLYSGAGGSDSACTGCQVTVRNNIITNNGVGIRDRTNGINVFTSTYNLFNGNTGGNHVNVTSGTGNQTANPLYANAPTDFHLQSQFGRWNGSTFVNDAQTSPGIDAGDPASDFSRETEDNGDRINVGRYGNTAEASRSSSSEPPSTDTQILHPDTIFTE